MVEFIWKNQQANKNYATFTRTSVWIRVFYLTMDSQGSGSFGLVLRPIDGNYYQISHLHYNTVYN